MKAGADEWQQINAVNIGGTSLMAKYTGWAYGVLVVLYVVFYESMDRGSLEFW